MDNIQAEDSTVKAALSSVRLDDTPGGMRNNFEAAVAFLLPTDPVEKKKAKSKRPIAEVSAVEGEDGPPKTNPSTSKPGRGKTGVEFRYHTPDEYQALNKAQRQELHAHRKGKGSEKKFSQKKGQKKRRFKATVAAIFKESMKEMEEEKAKEDEARASNRKELHEAIVAALKIQGGDVGANPLKARVAAVESGVKPTTPPKDKAGKAVHFAPPQPPQVENPFAEEECNASAEVAATKLLNVIERMGSGAASAKKGSQ